MGFTVSYSTKWQNLTRKARDAHRELHYFKTNKQTTGERVKEETPIVYSFLSHKSKDGALIVKVITLKLTSTHENIFFKDFLVSLFFC